jgi:hypothetical protein
VSETEASVGLSVLRAREAPIAVVLRQGPTKQVRMIRWRLDTDEFERGQWFAGRLYPERSDVSPDGRFLLTFAMRRGNTWNAISRPPWFSPIAVWEDQGTWGGGGFWPSSTEVRLRTNPAAMPLDPKFKLPSWLTVGWATGAFDRDGWRQPGPDANPYLEGKLHPTISAFELQRRAAIPIAVGSNTDRHAYAFRIVDHKHAREHELFTADWADWHPSGDLAIARDGLIQRIAIVQRHLAEPKVIADFTGDTFEKIAPPADALIW